MRRMRSFSTVLQRRIGIAHPGEIAGPRPRVQLSQHHVMASRGLGLRDLRASIGEVAEDDRPGGTYRLTGGEHFAIAYPSVLLVRLDVGRFDALDAVGALLHHAAPS